MRFTITIDSNVSNAAFEKIQAMASRAVFENLNLNGASINVERGDFTCVDGPDEIAGAQMLADVHRIIEGSIAALLVYTVTADRDTGEWIGEPEYTGRVTRLKDWCEMKDTHAEHYDTYEHFVDSTTSETRAVVLRFAD